MVLGSRDLFLAWPLIRVQTGRGRAVERDPNVDQFATLVAGGVLTKSTAKG